MGAWACDAPGEGHRTREGEASSVTEWGCRRGSAARTEIRNEVQVIEEVDDLILVVVGTGCVGGEICNEIQVIKEIDYTIAVVIGWADTDGGLTGGGCAAGVGDCTADAEDASRAPRAIEGEGGSVCATGGEGGAVGAAVWAVGEIGPIIWCGGFENLPAIGEGAPVACISTQSKDC